MKRRERAAKVLEILRQGNPEPRTELHYSSPWQLLVAAVLSAQAIDSQVNKVTKTLFAKYPGPAEIAALTPEQLAEEIKSLGLYHNKARHLVATARLVVSAYGGRLPGTRAGLQSLPGVGRKTANIILSTVFGLPALAVDTHVFRVAGRLGLAQGRTPEETERQLMRVIPRNLWTSTHHWLVLHGRYVCQARRPRCRDCPLCSYCQYYSDNSGSVDNLPSR
jgi:endonuclease-3